MMQYTWKTSPDLLKVGDVGALENVVQSVTWILKGEGNGRTWETSGTTHLDVPTPETFTEFSTLKEEQVMEWVKAQLGTAAIDHYKSILKGQCESEKAPREGHITKVYVKSIPKLNWEDLTES